jgi:hypothetical protein
VRFALLVGLLSLAACAVFVTVRLRSLNRKPAGFPPVYGNKAVPFSHKLRP